MPEALVKPDIKSIKHKSPVVTHKKLSGQKHQIAKAVLGEFPFKGLPFSRPNKKGKFGDFLTACALVLNIQGSDESLYEAWSHKSLTMFGETVAGQPGGWKPSAMKGYLATTLSPPKNPDSVERLYQLFEVEELTSKPLGWFQLYAMFPDQDPDLNDKLKASLQYPEPVRIHVDAAAEIKDIQSQLDQATQLVHTCSLRLLTLTKLIK